MRRRGFLAGFGAAAACPLVGRAQQGAIPVIGFLGVATSGEWADFLAAFRKGLREGGYEEGRNIAIEFRWAEGRSERLPALAAELSTHGIAAIATSTGIFAARAAQTAVGGTPVVFVMGGDPVQLGVVPNLNRPGGTVTGVSFILNALTAKRMEILREITPGARRVGLLVNPRNPNTDTDVHAAENAARGFGQEVHRGNVSDRSELAAAFASFANIAVEALLIASDPLFLGARAELVELAARYRLPAMFDRREIAAAGGLVSYGPSFAEAHRQAALYVARILRGEKPGDLPVLQPTTYELVINMKTARTLGVAIPQPLLVAADEVIE